MLVFRLAGMDPSVSLTRLALRHGFRGRPLRDPASATEPLGIARRSALRSRRSASSATEANRRVTRIGRVLSALVERKTLDVNLGASLTTGGTITELSAIAQGVGNGQRSGLKVTPVSLYVDLAFQAEASAVANEIRVIVFRWNDTGTPSGSDICPGLNSLINWSERPRFKILDDAKFQVESTSTGTYAFYRKSFRFPATDRIMYTSPVSTSGEVGRFFILMFSDSIAIPDPVSVGYSRLQFVDL